MFYVAEVLLIDYCSLLCYECLVGIALLSVGIIARDHLLHITLQITNALRLIFVLASSSGEGILHLMHV